MGDAAQALEKLFIKRLINIPPQFFADGNAIVVTKPGGEERQVVK